MRLEKLDDKTTCVEIHIPKPEERAGLMLMDALVQSGITNKELAYAQLEEYEAGVSPIVLPLSVPARIVPSSTAGHFHFYIDHEMEWLVYKQLLTALYRAGVIGEDFYGMSVEWKVSFLLMPGLTKENLKIILHAGATSHQP